MTQRHFLEIPDFSKAEVLETIDRSLVLKKLVKSGDCPQLLARKTLAMVFEKSSTRTRVSFEVAMTNLGGHAIVLDQQTSQLGRGESYGDTARVLSRYVQGIMFRTFSHDRLLEFAKHATVPIINGLSDSFHPCQVLTDLVTLKEKGLDLQNMTVAYVGDGNNMAHSWMNAAFVLGFNLRIATPKDFAVDPAIKAKVEGARITYHIDPIAAVKDCEAINTDTWFSMGQAVSGKKRKAFWPFQVNAALLAQAKKNALVLHCLPAHREEEITDEVIDGPQSVVFDQAENRVYAQMAVLEKLMVK